jgi:hypothetical protein
MATNAITIEIEGIIAPTIPALNPCRMCWLVKSIRLPSFQARRMKRMLPPQVKVTGISYLKIIAHDLLLNF